MKFTVFRQEFTKAQLKDCPELAHLQLPRDRMLYWRFNAFGVLGAIAILAAWQLGFWLSNIFNVPDWIGLGWYFGLPLIGLWLIVRVAPVYALRYLHRALRARGIYYCSNKACRYNCTGIRGDICPECGSLVPGLSLE